MPWEIIVSANIKKKKNKIEKKKHIEMTAYLSVIMIKG